MGGNSVLSSESDSEDDVPLSQLRRARPSSPVQTEASSGPIQPEIKAEVAVETQDEDEDDSDDDVPISQLASRQPPPPQPVPPQRSAPLATRIKREIPTENHTTNSRPKKKFNISYKQQECTEELYKTLKGQLVQQLLCRWWYAMEWPKADFKTEHPHEKLHGAQELDGFKGAYIRVKGDAMGTILDTRSSQDKPSFFHFFALPSQDIKDLLQTAYKTQMQVLRDHEGENAPLLKELASALKAVEKVSPTKADKSVRKVLQQFQEFAAAIGDEQLK